MGHEWIPGTLTAALPASALKELEVELLDGLDCYTSVNGFMGSKRASSQLRQANSMLFDLDAVSAHSGGNASECEAAKDGALALIEAAVAQGRFPEPTMAVDTGRGLQLHIVLARSCSARLSDGSANEALLGAFSRMQGKLYARLGEILAPLHGIIELDKSCADLARLCRVPGTLNTKAGDYAELVHSSGPYWSLDALRRFATFGERPACVKAGKQGQGQRWGQSFFRARAHAMERLRDLRQGKGDDLGYRNELVFCYMNNLINIMPLDEAYEQALAFNASLAVPLRQSELLSTRRCLERRKAPYAFTNSGLIEHLSMTDREAELCGLTAKCTCRALERAEACRRTEKRKVARNEEILELAKKGIAYREIAGAVGCCLRTVKAVLKAKGYSRNATKEEGEQVSIQVQRICRALADVLASANRGSALQVAKAQNEKCKKLSLYSCDRGAPVVSVPRKGPAGVGFGDLKVETFPGRPSAEHLCGVGFVCCQSVTLPFADLLGFSIDRTNYSGIIGLYSETIQGVDYEDNSRFELQGGRGQDDRVAQPCIHPRQQGQARPSRGPRSSGDTELLGG